MPEIITRAEALARRLKRYFTGMVCGNGHLCERLTSSGDCVECETLARIRRKMRRAGGGHRGKTGRPTTPHRDMALADGKSTYFTGMPCPHGHLCERTVHGRHCLECKRARDRRRHREIASLRPPRQREPRAPRVPWRKTEAGKAYHKKRNKVDVAASYYRNHEVNKAKNRERSKEWTRRARIALQVLEELGIEV